MSKIIEENIYNNYHHLDSKLFEHMMDTLWKREESVPSLFPSAHCSNRHDSVAVAVSFVYLNCSHRWQWSWPRGPGSRGEKRAPLFDVPSAAPSAPRGSSQSSPWPRAGALTVTPTLQTRKPGEVAFQRPTASKQRGWNSNQTQGLASAACPWPTPYGCVGNGENWKSGGEKRGGKAQGLGEKGKERRPQRGVFKGTKYISNCKKGGEAGAEERGEEAWAPPPG